MRTFTGFALLILPLAALLGCADDKPVEPAVTVQWTKPGLGSTFTYAGYLTDSNHVKISGSDETYTDSVMATGVAARGLTGLNRMTYSQFFQILLEYRANGDLAMALEDPDGVELPWTVFPVGSKGTITHDAWSLTLGDSISSSTWSTPYTLVTYMGAEQAVTPAGTFATHRILVRAYDTTSSGDPYIENDTAWFAPAIGTYVRRARRADMVRSDRGMRVELTSYTPK